MSSTSPPAIFSRVWDIRSSHLFVCLEQLHVLQSRHNVSTPPSILLQNSPFTNPFLWRTVERRSITTVFIGVKWRHHPLLDKLTQKVPTGLPLRPLLLSEFQNSSHCQLMVLKHRWYKRKTHKPAVRGKTSICSIRRFFNRNLYISYPTNYM